MEYIQYIHHQQMQDYLKIYYLIIILVIVKELLGVHFIQDLYLCILNQTEHIMVELFII